VQRESGSVQTASTAIHFSLFAISVEFTKIWQVWARNAVTAIGGVAGSGPPKGNLSQPPFARPYFNMERSLAGDVFAAAFRPLSFGSSDFRMQQRQPCGRTTLATGMARARSAKIDCCITLLLATTSIL